VMAGECKECWIRNLGESRASLARGKGERISMWLSIHVMFDRAMTKRQSFVVVASKECSAVVPEEG
jgi:hypothetical protein